MSFAEQITPFLLNRVRSPLSAEMVNSDDGPAVKIDDVLIVRVRDEVALPEDDWTRGKILLGLTVEFDDAHVGFVAGGTIVTPESEGWVSSAIDRINDFCRSELEAFLEPIDEDEEDDDGETDAGYMEQWLARREQRMDYVRRNLLEPIFLR